MITPPAPPCGRQIVFFLFWGSITKSISETLKSTPWKKASHAARRFERTCSFGISLHDRQTERCVALRVVFVVVIGFHTGRKTETHQTKCCVSPASTQWMVVTTRRYHTSYESCNRYSASNPAPFAPPLPVPLCTKQQNQSDSTEVVQQRFLLLLLSVKTVLAKS